MAINSILPPYPVFADTTGKPLEAGFIYIGQPGFEARSTPKASFFDAAATIPTGTATGAAVRTSGGYPIRNGAASMIYVDGGYSITVTDKNGVVIYTSLTSTLEIGNPSSMVAPILAPDGNLVATGYGYISEPNTGRVRSAAGVEQDVILGNVVAQRSAAGSEFVLPVTIDAIRSSTNLNLLTTGEGCVVYTNTATGAEAGAYTATMRYRGNGTIAVQEAYIPGVGFRIRTYAASTWSAWSSPTAGFGMSAFILSFLAAADKSTAATTLGVKQATPVSKKGLSGAGATSFAVTTSSFTAPVDGIAKISGGFDATVAFNAATSTITASLGAVANADGTAGPKSFGTIAMAAGQSSTFTVSVTNSTAGFLMPWVTMEFIPTP